MALPSRNKCGNKKKYGCLLSVSVVGFDKVTLSKLWSMWRLAGTAGTAGPAGLFPAPCFSCITRDLPLAEALKLMTGSSSASGHWGSVLKSNIAHHNIGFKAFNAEILIWFDCYFIIISSLFLFFPQQTYVSFRICDWRVEELSWLLKSTCITYIHTYIHTHNCKNTLQFLIKVCSI